MPICHYERRAYADADTPMIALAIRHAIVAADAIYA